MTQEVTLAKRPVESWLAQTLRLTVFTSPTGTDVVEPNWRQDVVGETPENRTSKPRTKALKEDGPFGTGKLVFSLQPSRIDWLYAATVGAPEMEESGFPSLGNFTEALEKFRPAMLRWLEHCPAITRMAFGAVLLMPVEDLPTGYRQLAAYLPNVKIDPEGSVNFLYQINRRRLTQCDVSNLTINRLCKWSVAALKVAQVSLGDEADARLIGPEEVACHLELDVNTSPDPSLPLPHDKLPEIFQELASLGTEIAAKGDIS